MEPERVLEELGKQQEWAKSVVFTHNCEVIASRGFEPNPDELSKYLTAYDSRDATIGPGFVLDGEHYDVHRFHPPLIYGRRGGPDEGAGIALCKAMTTAGNPIFSLITYELPYLSARAVPQLIEFARQNLGTVEIPPPETP